MTDLVLNIERLTLLRDTIDNLSPTKFNMNYWCTGGNISQLKHDCGTAGCIGGWAEVLFFPIELLAKDTWRHNTYDVGEELGLDSDQTNALFFPDDVDFGEDPDSVTSIDQLTQAQAVETLTRLIDTGMVDWKHAKLEKADD